MGILTDTHHLRAPAALGANHIIVNVDNFLTKKLLYINKRYYLYHRLKRD